MYSVGMALVDFIPVTCFLIASIFLQRDLYNKMSKGSFALFAAGTIDVFMAGFLKALYKLLYTLNVCDFERLSQMFFPVQAIGFVLAGLGIIAMLISNSKKDKIYAAAVPAVFSGTMIFVTFMVLGVGCVNIGMSIVAAKMKKPLCIVLFALSLVFTLGMGYLATKDFTQSYMNWIAEGVNVIGQGLFLLGVLLLHKNGLKEYKI